MTNEYISFIVTLVRPPNATSDEIAEYIQEAVQTWREQVRPPATRSDDDPGDPMWGLDSTTVGVRRYKR